MKDLLAFGCGQCLPCRINKQRLWVHRIMLETLKHPQSSFVTLTYAPEKVPPMGTLNPAHTRDWLKRLRHAYSIRYYLVGEYGDQTQRPHYHAALFGIGCLDAANCSYARKFKRPERLCSTCKTIQDTWNMGFTDVGTLTKESSAYICGYVTKKMTNPKNDQVKEFLQGRHPEFARMSLKPGIGATAMDEVAQTLETDFGRELLEREKDVPQILAHGRRKLPLGRYLRGKLREKMGMEKNTPEEVLQQIKNEMCKLYLDYRYDEKTPKKEKLGQKEWLLRENKQRVLSLEARTKLYKGIKTL